MEENEIKLVRLSAKGDKDAFGGLVEKYQNLIFTICYRYLGNREDAQDATQEAFIKAYRGLRNFREEASFKTWLTRIAANLCTDRLRRRKHDVLSLAEASLQEGDTIADDPCYSPEDVFDQKESNSYLQGLLNTLTPEYRIVVIMRDIQGLKYEEIAAELQISLGTVKSRLNRARKALRDQIQKDRELSRSNLRLTE